MGCIGHRRKLVEVKAEQKWDYINLGDFKARGCFTPFAYGYLWFSIIISLAVYGVDTYTAVNLLAFDTWSSKVEPEINKKIDRTYSKWIFAGCIIASFVNLGFEHVRAMRIMKRGNVAECYLDNLAVRMESIRFGKGQGFRRFLVFAELTKSKKGAEYIALFTYFSFQTWIRVIICSGPRQIVNAFTLQAVYVAQLNPEKPDVESSFTGFFGKIQELARDDYQQATILIGMAFTLIVWVFSMVFLLAAVIFYILFLWHWIPRADGGLAGYCERKVNKALTKIVTKTVNKAILKEQETRMKADAKAARKNGEKFTLERQATLPTLPNVGIGNDDKLPEMPTMHRNETTTTLPLYTSRPGTPGSIELNSMGQRRPMPSRTGTMSSTGTFSSRAPLMGGAAEMGSIGPQSPAPSLPSIDMSHYPPPPRPGTASSQRSFSRSRPPHNQSNSASSFAGSYTETPVSYSSEIMPPFPPPVRSPTARTMDSYGRQVPRDNYGRPSPTASVPFDRFSGSDGRSSPALSYSSRSNAPLPRTPAPLNPGGYQAYQPPRSATNPASLRNPQNPPHRNMTAPVPQRQPTEDYFSRQRPSQGSSPGYNHDVESQSRRY